MRRRELKFILIYILIGIYKLVMNILSESPHTGLKIELC